MLTKLTITNFKSIAQETIEFSSSGLTVLVGPNGAGKSTVLEAAYDIAATSLNPPDLPPFPEADMVRRGAQEWTLLSCFSAGGDSRVVSASRRLLPSGASMQIELQSSNGLRLSMRNDGANSARAEAVDAWKLLPRPRMFDVNVRALRLPLQPPSTPMSSSFDESRVLQVLLEAKLLGDPAPFAQIGVDVQKVVPSLKAVNLARSFDGIEKYSPVFDMSSGAKIPASQVSEGTLLALALVTATRVEQPTLLLIDDLDRALHPLAQREVVRMLKAAVKALNVQVICTTHSPYILSEFAFDEVRVLRDVNGETKCRRLDEGPDAARWMKELDAGEYWSFVEPRLFDTGT